MFLLSFFRANAGALSRSNVNRPVLRRLRLALLGAALFAGVGAGTAVAADREVVIVGPSTARAGAVLSVSVRADTWARGEKIGFFHAQYSMDGGTTWKDLCFDENVGTSATRQVAITAGAAGTKVVVRSRVAFRGGAAGDVDFKGQPIDWAGTWEKWRGPPTRYLVIPVAGS
jgi:hypothetical protein